MSFSVYLSGDFDGLRWHFLGANAVTVLGYPQLIVAIAVWVRLRLKWPFLTTVAVVAAETAQYVAGVDGALWLHLPLGLMSASADRYEITQREANVEILPGTFPGPTIESRRGRPITVTHRN